MPSQVYIQLYILSFWLRLTFALRFDTIFCRSKYDVWNIVESYKYHQPPMPFYCFVNPHIFLSRHTFLFQKKHTTKFSWAQGSDVLTEVLAIVYVLAGPSLCCAQTNLVVFLSSEFLHFLSVLFFVCVSYLMRLSIQAFHMAMACNKFLLHCYDENF